MIKITCWHGLPVEQLAGALLDIPIVISTTEICTLTLSHLMGSWFLIH